MEIKELLAHVSNYSKGRHTTIKYIVLHYTANNGDTALSNCKYFSGANRNASAHYFVDEQGIYRSVRDMNVAWHCGSTNGYKHKYCRNTNSIGIEMCSRKDKNGKFYIKEETIANAIELTNFLLEKYDIKVENVIRHYDVTGKICPRPFVEDEMLWIDFKERLEEEEVKRYNTIDEVPEWGKATIQLMINKGAFADVKYLNLSEDMVRMFVFNNRMGMYK
nr:MAG TPA: N acetylmuramoyl L alanine amidase endolysin [Caudoviricetes sp.]